MKSIVGEKIKENRDKAGYTQEELANRIGVSRQTLSKWENGKTYPDIGNVLLLAELFETTVDAFIRETTTTEVHVHKEQRLRQRHRQDWIIMGVLTMILLVSLVSLKVVHDQKALLEEKVALQATELDKGIIGFQMTVKDAEGKLVLEKNIDRLVEGEVEETIQNAYREIKE